MIERPMRPKTLICLSPALLLPITIAGVLWRLDADRESSEIPMARKDDPVPTFSLPPLEGSELPGLSDADLRSGEVVLVNVFASWCYPCRVEHPYLMNLSRARSIPIYGINYKARPSDALKWLDEAENPYVVMGDDEDGKVSVDWGISGVPETLVIDQGGAIRYRQVGPLDPGTLEEVIFPLISSLRERES